ncbi:MAG: serine hydrolase domain-containing protein, partial [Myxococcota bacterium]
RSKPDFPAGTAWRYSNTGFYVAALHLEGHSKKSFGTLLHDELLVPARLAGVKLCDAHSGPVARGYERRERQWVAAGSVFEERGIFGDGGVCGTILELVRMPKALKTVLGDDFERLLEPTRLPDGSAVDYGLGVRLGSLRGRKMYGHTGGMGTYWSTVAYFPSEDLSIAVLVNTDGAREDALSIFGRVATEVLELNVDRDAFERGEYPLDHSRPHSDGRCALYYNGLFAELGECPRRSTQ